MSPLSQNLSSNGFLKTTSADGRPPWELVGVQVVKDVDSYELMKLRLLNGGHSAMGYFGILGRLHLYT
ncbi:CFF_collapsed_G0048900.mRNA.1.CDS.1 [Saccharomyces cerevisiae]|nr:CFF_collapsed_G0048900.mRNA.1.CDS.1 [Saccharomyces cerevisiae]